MEPGTLVEYKTADDGYRLGAVVDLVGKTKLVVMTASGEENRPEREDVTFTLAGDFEPSDRAAAANAVKRVARRVAAIEHQLDLTGVWAIAGSGRSYELEELAEASGNTDPLAQIALRRVLRADDVYFRQRKGHIEARSVGQVEEGLREQELLLARTDRRAGFVSAIARVLAQPHGTRAQSFRTLEAEDAEFARQADLLRGFAADDTAFPRRQEAEALLDDIVQESGLELSARATPRGFELMRELELWGEHEVLALHRFSLPTRHSTDVLELASAAAEAPFDPDGRADFTGWWSLTIDDSDSRDIDDALSIRPTLDGGWELAIHIADASEFVPIGGALDHDAQRRGSTMYLPDAVFGVFAAPLSERAMSLVEGERRPALTTHVTLDGDLAIVDWEIVMSVVEVNRRISYDEADALLDGTGNDHTTSVLRDLAFIADELHARRLARGARPIELPEPRVRVTHEEGESRVDVTCVEPSPAHSLVAEMMVLVGELTARFAMQRGVPVIFRVQEPPHAERGDDRIRRVPQGWAREMAVLITMQRGGLSTQPAEHAALGLSAYVQATSPIRRYTDLVVQRQLKAVLRGEAVPYDSSELQRVASVVERAQHDISTAEREAAAYWILEHLRRREGQTIDAVVVGVQEDSRRADVILKESGFRTHARLKPGVELGSTVTLRIDRSQPRPPKVVLEQV